MRYNFVDKTGNVELTVACTKDAGQEEYWSMMKSTLAQEKKYEPDLVITDETHGKNGEYYVLHSDPKEFTKAKKQYTSVVYYKDYDGCYGRVTADSREQDKDSIKKGIVFLENGVKFGAKYKLPTTYSGSFFQAKGIVPPDVHIIEGISKGNDTFLSILFKLKINRWISGDFSYMKFKKKSDYFTELFTNSKQYTGSYTFDGLFRQFQMSSNVDTAAISRSKNNKPYILTRYYDIKNQEENLKVIYPFTLGDEFYYVFIWSSTFKFEPEVDLEYIFDFFHSLDFVGEEALPM